MKKIIKTNLQGFTLLEIMIVIVILGILAALISGNFITSLMKGRDARRKEDLNQIQKALEMYYEDKKAYPTPAAVPNALPYGSSLSDPVSGKVYMENVPNDPGGTTSNSYGYTTDSGGTYYKLYACLENNQQVLPYKSASSTITCPTSCTYTGGGTTQVPCIWGVSSTNAVP